MDDAANGEQAPGEDVLTQEKTAEARRLKSSSVFIS
jgi:hypothetical protein